MFQSKNFLLYISIAAVTLVSGLIYFNLDHTTQSIAQAPQVKLHRKGKIVNNVASSVVFPTMQAREMRRKNSGNKVVTPKVKVGLRTASNTRTLLKTRNSGSVNALGGQTQKSTNSVSTKVAKQENASQLMAQNFSNKPVSRAGLFQTTASQVPTMQKEDGFNDPLDNPYEAPLRGGSFLIVLLALYGFMKKIYRF